MSEAASTNVLTKHARSQAREVVVCLLWGAVLTFLLGVWAGQGISVPLRWGCWLVALLAGAMAGWHGFTLWGKNPDAALRQAALAKQRPIIGLAALACGAAQVVGGIAVWFLAGLDGLGLALSLGVMGCASLIWGQGVRTGPAAIAGAAESVHPLVQLMQVRGAGWGAGVLASAAVVVAVYLLLMFRLDVPSVIVPELTGLALLALLLSGIGMALYTTKGPLSEAEARIYVVTLGGGVGLIVFAASILRIWAWRGTVLFGGLQAWQGLEGWRFWVAIYASLAGLALMFASFVPARTEIRSTPTLRRVLFGYNTILSALLLFVVLIVGNIVVNAVLPYQFNWTGRGLYALSETTKNLLGRLKKPVTIYVLADEPSGRRNDVRLLLENCETESPTMFKVRTITGATDRAEREKLMRNIPAFFQEHARLGPLPTDDGLLVVYGELDEAGKSPAFEFIPDRKLFEEKREHPRMPPKTTFKGEQELVHALTSLIQDKSLNVYFLQGHGEMSLDGPGERIREITHELKDLSISVLAEALTDQHIQVKGFTFETPDPAAKPSKSVVFVPENSDKTRSIPADADVLIIAGPSKVVPQATLNALERYLDGGGKMLVFFDVIAKPDYSDIVQTGLEDLLRRYGVDVQSEYVMNAVSPQTDPVAAFARAASKSSLSWVKQFRRFPMQEMPTYHGVRVVRPIAEAGDYQAEVLLEFEPKWNIWTESSAKALINPAQHRQQLAVSKRLRFSGVALPIGVASSRTFKNKPAQLQLLVFGDAEFIANDALRRTNDFSPNGALWTATAVLSMADRPGPVIPAAAEVQPFVPKADAPYGPMLFIPGWLMTVLLFGLGVGLWLVRRR